jgi:hypothetical protein
VCRSETSRVHVGAGQSLVGRALHVEVAAPLHDGDLRLGYGVLEPALPVEQVYAVVVDGASRVGVALSSVISMAAGEVDPGEVELPQQGTESRPFSLALTGCGPDLTGSARPLCCAAASQPRTAGGAGKEVGRVEAPSGWPPSPPLPRFGLEARGERGGVCFTRVAGH